MPSSLSGGHLQVVDVENEIVSPAALEGSLFVSFPLSYFSRLTKSALRICYAVRFKSMSYAMRDAARNAANAPVAVVDELTVAGVDEAVRQRSVTATVNRTPSQAGAGRGGSMQVASRLSASLRPPPQRARESLPIQAPTPNAQASDPNNPRPSYFSRRISPGVC